MNGKRSRWSHRSAAPSSASSVCFTTCSASRTFADQCDRIGKFVSRIQFREFCTVCWFFFDFWLLIISSITRTLSLEHLSPQPHHHSIVEEKRTTTTLNADAARHLRRYGCSCWWCWNGVHVAGAIAAAAVERTKDIHVFLLLLKHTHNHSRNTDLRQYLAHTLFD